MTALLEDPRGELADEVDMVTSMMSTNIAAVSVTGNIIHQASCLILVPPLSDSARIDQLGDKVVYLMVGGAGAGLDHRLCVLRKSLTSDGGDGVDILQGYYRGSFINISDQGVAKYPPL